MVAVIISDASALILIEKIKLLDKLINKLNFVIPREVEKEAIIFGKNKKYPDAFRLEEKINNNMILVKDVKDRKSVKKIMEDFNIEKGEAESIVLFNQERADLLATDDRLAIKACKALSVPISGTCTFVTQSFDSGIISKNEAINMLQILAKEGRYKYDIIFKALNHIGGQNEI